MKHEQRVVQHVSGTTEVFGQCVCGKPWPCPGAAPLYARYDVTGGWYYCWLVERRDRSQPQWMCNDGTWTTDAHKAQWFARRSDADEVAGEIVGDAVVGEHGFMLAVP